MKITLTIFGLLLLSSLSSQDIKRLEFQFNIGTNISFPSTRSYETMVQFEGHPETKYASQFGYFAEVLMTYSFNKNLGLQSGVNYNNSKLKVVDKTGLIESKGDITTTYIQLPILIKYRLSDSFPFTFAGGVYCGLMLNACQNGTSVFDITGLETSPDGEIPLVEPVFNYSDDIKTNFKDLDFGLSFQMGYEFNISEKYSGLFFSRFNYGLIDLKSDEFYVGSNYSIGKWHNIGLLIGIGIKI